MKVKHGLGYQNYEDMMSNHIFYIDKTNFITEWWDYADKVTLITRPRRFGKTLNLSTVECFFSNKYQGRDDLFEGRQVWENEALRKLQGTYPVVFMSFASVKSGYDETKANENMLDNVEAMKTAVKQVISDIYAKYRDIIKSEMFDENDRAFFASVNDNMTDKTAHVAIRRLCGYLEKFYGKKVIVLLDEYDTPMQESWLYGYWNHALSFFRSFFVTTFKDNDSIERGLITGITRVSKESIFSELNHLEVVTTISDKYAASFGFTEEEVFQALDELKLSEHKQGVKKWYDGFTFGKHTDIYNPWSIIAFISKKGEYAPYWANTSSNSLVSALIQAGDVDAKKTVEDLMQGKSFTAPIDEQIALNQLEGNTNAVWSLLLASGYLRMIGREPLSAERKRRPRYTLTLTNMEVVFMFEDMVRDWFEMDAESSAYNDFIKAMLLDDLDYMNEFMNEIALKSFSSFDIAKNASCDDHPERFYHGFVLGLMVGLRDQYEITSNRESGFGRYDIVLKPYDRQKNSAYIIEFKVFKASKEKTLEDTVANALKQIEEKQYQMALTTDGFAPEQIRKYGFAFQGKTCLIGK